jgi:hypothetical protein
MNAGVINGLLKEALKFAVVSLFRIMSAQGVHTEQHSLPLLCYLEMHKCLILPISLERISSPLF